MLKNIYLTDIRFFFILVFALHFFWIFDSDDGVVLAAAWDMYNGKVLYKDIFAYISPLSFYFVLFTWKIFWPSYFIAKFFSILLFTFSVFGILKISEIFISNKFSIIPAFIYLIYSFIWPIINHNTYSIFFVIWSIYFFLQYLKNYQYKILALSSFLASVSFLFLQHKGLFILAAYFFWIIFNSIKNNNFNIKEWFVYSISSLVPIVFLFLYWGPQTILNNLFIFPRQNYSSVNDIPNFLLFISFFILVIFYIIIRKKSKKIYFIFFVQLFLLLSVIPRPDSYHILLSGFLLIILFIASVERFIHQKYYRPTFYFVLIFLFLILLSQIYVKNLIFNTYKKNNETLEYISQECSASKYIYAGPFLPFLYFETKKINPSPYSLLLTGLNPQEQFDKVRENLELKKPSCAILNYSIVEKFSYNKNNPVDNYIKENYYLLKKTKNFEIYKIK